MAVIDLNSDLGEGFGPWPMGDDAAMLDIVTSANIACGGHASDPDTMAATVQAAMQRGVVIGAHPGYADRLGFGRRVIPMSPAEITRMVAAQIGALAGIAALSGARVAYVKAHGALANYAADHREVADAIVTAVAAMAGRPALLAISGTELEQAARAADYPVYSEIFADRAYLASGRLVPRNRPGAVIHDAAEATARLVRFFETGLMPVIDGDPIPLAAQSICVHGDTAGAVQLAAELKAGLTQAGIRIAPFIA